MRTIVSKGEFAARMKRAPSAISNWIADGRITPAAIMGTGVRAQIWVEQAERDLARNLDPGQQLSQERPIGAAPAATAPVTAAPAAPGAGDLLPPETSEDEDLRRRRKADADRAEREAERAKLRTEREYGRWLDVAEAQKAWGKELSNILTEIEAFVTSTMPRDLADHFNLDPREVATLIITLWRERRARAAKEAEAREAELTNES